MSCDLWCRVLLWCCLVWLQNAFFPRGVSRHIGTYWSEAKGCVVRCIVHSLFVVFLGDLNHILGAMPGKFVFLLC